MDTPIKTSPKDFFMHLLNIIALYASVVSFLTLMFSYIEALLPDPLNYYYEGILSSIRWSSSVLIVVFFVYILICWLIGKDFKLVPEKRELKVRKWLVYFTLFIAAITIIVDLVTLLYRFYGGEYTGQFILKVFVVLLVAVAIFWYYFTDLKRQNYQSKIPKIFGWVTSVIVLIAVVGGFFIVGSPATQRARRFDDQRIMDLQNIQAQIVNYWQNKNKLPTKLGDLVDNISGFTPSTDPETKLPYEYVVKSILAFDLCANFKTENKNSNWSHTTGRVCFSRIIDPELYKLNKPQPL